MKPYAGLHPKEYREGVFNYLLSQARRAVENVFGIMSVFNAQKAFVTRTRKSRGCCFGIFFCQAAEILETIVQGFA